MAAMYDVLLVHRDQPSQSISSRARTLPLSAVIRVISRSHRFGDLLQQRRRSPRRLLCSYKRALVMATVAHHDRPNISRSSTIKRRANKAYNVSAGAPVRTNNRELINALAWLR